MRIDDEPCEITRIETDHFYGENTPLYYFTFDGKEESFYYDDENDFLWCSIGEDDGMMTDWDEIDIADIPKPVEIGENPFEGKVYCLDGGDSHTLEITKLDTDGNIIEIVVDGTALEMSNSATDPNSSVTTYSMEYEDADFISSLALRIYYYESEEKCEVEILSTDDLTPPVDIAEGSYYYIKPALDFKSSSYQSNLIGRIYAFTTSGEFADPRTFTVLSFDENGLITEIRINDNDISLTDCRFEKKEANPFIYLYYGSFDNGNATIEMEYNVNKNYFTLNFSYVPQYEPRFDTINGNYYIQ